MARRRPATPPKIPNATYLSFLGSGGFADVYLYEQQIPRREVAIKVLRRGVADAQRQSFRAEANLMARMSSHPSIVSVYGAGEAGDERMYLIMEYCPPPHLGARLRQQPFTVTHALEIGIQIGGAIETLHRAGIVHRDIKPGNIMLTSTGAVKVMDFGIARAVEDSAATVTQTHAVVGTAQYLSPEQARGEVVDARSDLYSTGCLLYELLTGQPPFTGDSAVAIAYQHVREIPKPPSSLAADVPESLDRVVLKSLAKARDDRYQDAAHMRADLLAASRGLAVAAPATDSWQQGTSVMNSPAAPSPSPSAPAPPAPVPQSTTPDETVEDTPRRRWWVWLLAPALLILLGIAIGMIFSNRLPGGNGGATSTPTATATAAVVPDVSGMSQSDAKSAIESAGLVFVKGDDVSSDTIDAGQAVSSDPGAGTSALLGTSITVSFSSGSATVYVPDVTGMSQSEARKTIEGANLSWGDVTVENPSDGSVDEGDVIRSSPAKGTQVTRG